MTTRRLEQEELDRCTAASRGPYGREFPAQESQPGEPATSYAVLLDGSWVSVEKDQYGQVESRINKAFTDEMMERFKGLPFSDDPLNDIAYAPIDPNREYLLDHVAGLRVREGDAVNELGTLANLAVGLWALASNVAAIEHPLVSTRVNRFSFGPNVWRSLGLTETQGHLLPCLFHWFGTSLCNFARLIGFCSGVGSGIFPRNATEDPSMFKKIEHHCNGYVASIPELQPVKQWRDKVFAHFALTAPRGGKQVDTAALLDLSVMSPIGYGDQKFHVGGIEIMTRGGAATLPQWSVTDVWQKLKPRFWPDLSLPSAAGR